MIFRKFTSIPRYAVTAALCIGIASIPGLAQTPNVAGVANFHQVNDHVYRGAQPTDLGFQSLAHLGVKTVIDLREGGPRSDDERKLVERAGMRYVSIPLLGMSAPSPEKVSQVLALFNDASAGPVFVHCRRGADRTGTMVACYRISHDGWNSQKALQEAKDDGMSWTEIAMQHYVKRFQPQVETAATGVATAVPANNN
jgi:tyrosine-protein phosphatase SIW14